MNDSMFNQNGQGQQSANLGAVPFTPGRPIHVPTRAFTREVQESIIDNHFNGTGSVYAETIDNFNRAPQQQAQPVTPSQPAVQQANTQMSAEEIASLTRLKGMIAANPSILDEVARQQLGMNTSVQQAQPTGAGMPSAPITQAAPENGQPADIWGSIFSTESEQQNQQQQNTNQNDQQHGQVQATQPSQQPTQADQALYVECLKSGTDFSAVKNQVNQILADPVMCVELYRAWQDAQNVATQQAQQTVQQQAGQTNSPPYRPINLAEAPQPQNVQVLASAFSTNTRHPIFG